MVGAFGWYVIRCESNKRIVYFDGVKACEPLTLETFKKNCAAWLKEMKKPYHIQPDWYPHLTACCKRRFDTTGPCEKFCPYKCGKKWKGCLMCKALKHFFYHK
jgi:hypothetical protein